jgi:hypothetical protein
MKLILGLILAAAIVVSELMAVPSQSTQSDRALRLIPE